jgi:ABC-2 type transport system ATP-binding protein
MLRPPPDPTAPGKTTTIEICEGLLNPDAGTVEVLGMQWTRDGHALRSDSGSSFRRRNSPKSWTVAESMKLFRSFYPAGRVWTKS